MGEDQNRVTVTGIHELEKIKNYKTLSKIKFLKKYV